MKDSKFKKMFRIIEISHPARPTQYCIKVYKKKWFKWRGTDHYVNLNHLDRHRSFLNMYANIEGTPDIECRRGSPKDILNLYTLLKKVYADKLLSDAPPKSRELDPNVLKTEQLIDPN